jgi:hypothetical protein
LERRVVLTHWGFRATNSGTHGHTLVPVLTGPDNNGTDNILAVYHPQDLQVTNPITGQPVKYSVNHQLAQQNPFSPLLSNQGKIVSGKDRQGDEWTITVHGPGYVIVTDTTPNDGSLDDPIDTIQLVGTNLNTTYVTGNVISSHQVLTSGTVDFNQLIDVNGVNSIQLNGFNLAQTVTPPAGTANNLDTGIFLLGGVRDLEFNNIEAPVNTATGDAGINVVIGDSNNPLTVKPTIKLGSIDSTVYNSSLTAPPPLTPVTTPTVNIIVNGQINHLDLLSASSNIDKVLEAEGFNFQNVGAQAYLFPTIPTSGRTSVEATGINSINVTGGATNFTASRNNPPFQSSLSGLSHINTATFNGPTDAVGLDVNGPIGTLTFAQGISNTNNLFNGVNANGAEVPSTKYGTPANVTSFAGAGYVGGQVTATSIKKLHIKATEVNTQSPTNPDFVQLNGFGTYDNVVTPGTAAANAVITTTGNIGKTKIVGDLQNSEIKAGFDYNSFAAGLEGTRNASKIGPLHQKGNQTASVVSSTYRPFMNFYGTPLDVAGPGKITGNAAGTPTSTGAVTGLGNVGAGYYAKKIVGKLPHAPA